MTLNQLTDSEVDVSLSSTENELSRGDLAAARRWDQTSWDKNDLIITQEQLQQEQEVIQK